VAGSAGCLPAETVIAPAITPIVHPLEVILDGAPVAPDDVVPLPDGSLLVDGSVRDAMGVEAPVLVLVPGDGRSPQAIGEGGEVGAIRSVTTTGDVTLVVGEGGVLAIQGSTLFRVPVEAMLEVTEIGAIAALERPAEPGLLDWLVATDGGLFVVSDDVVRPLRAGGEPLAVTHLAPRGPGSAWAADAEGLVRITLSGGTEGAPQLERLARAGEIEALAADDEGRPWWVEDGVLFSLTRDLRVIARALPTAGGSPVGGITSLPRDGELWIHTGDPWEAGSDGLFHFDGVVFRPIDHPLDGRVVRCASGSECLVLEPASHALERLRVRHGAVLEGLAEGASLHDRTELRIVAEAADRVASMQASIDGAPVTVTDGAITLVPADVGFGPRTLVVTLTWADGTLPVVLRRSFTSEAPATWADDVQPVYATYCADCHGAAGPSARRLDSREGWMTEYDRLLPAITSGAMPLGRPRLPAETIALIETWAGAGFPE
jgi:hypothetical protein